MNEDVIEKRKLVYYPLGLEHADDDVEIRIRDKVELQKLNYREYVLTLTMLILVQVGFWYFINYGGTSGLFYPQEVSILYEKIKWLFYVGYALWIVVVIFLILRRTNRSVPILFKHKANKKNLEDNMSFGNFSIYQIKNDDETKLYFKTDFDDKLIDVAMKLEAVLSDLGFFESDLTNFIHAETTGKIMTLKIPRINRTELAKLEKTRQYLEAIFSYEIGAIWCDYEYFYIDYIEELFIPKADDIKKYDSYKELILYGFDYKGKPLYWDYLKAPDGIISSKNGQGKTVFLHGMLLSILNKNKHIIPTFLDGKGTALKRYRQDYTVYTALEVAEFIKVVSDFRAEMERRFLEFDEKGITDIRATDEYPVRMLVIDEHSAIIDRISEKKQLEQFMTNLDMIAKLGREAGFQTLTTIQQAHSRYISTDMRENSHFKAMMGGASSSNYSLLFGKEYANLQPLIVGQGYTVIDDVLTRFVFPNV